MERLKRRQFTAEFKLEAAKYVLDQGLRYAEVGKRLVLFLIKTIHQQSGETYGAPRIYAELKDKHDYTGSLNRVKRLMREHGIRAKGKRKFKATTDSQHKLPVAPNRLAQDFSAAAPHRVWLADITYLRTREGWLYLACVLDLFNREIVGWAMT